VTRVQTRCHKPTVLSSSQKCLSEGDFIDYDSDYDQKAEAARRPTNADPYAGIFFSKDRKEEVIEVEEQPQEVFMAEIGEKVPIMTQGQWMKGCPEGSEQSFLFSLYTQLCEGDCVCPNECGRSIPRKKQDFFAVMVRKMMCSSLKVSVLIIPLHWFLFVAFFPAIY
jgi:hypothetical protein